MQPISLLLVDDHQILIDLLVINFSNDPRFKICGKAYTSTQAVETAKKMRPDVVLMDIHIGPIDGFEATALIRKFSPMSKIVGLSASALPSYARKMKALGAMGYVTKCSPINEMTKAIVEAAKGNFYFCDVIRKIMDNEEKLYGRKEFNKDLLTTREIEIIQLIKLGLSSKQIAEKLEISFKTVDIHRGNILKKFKVNNVTSMIHAAHLHGI